MRTIAFMNQKGGSGKTTSAVNLAGAMGEAGKRVLVVDLDPQANSSTWLGAPDGEKGLLEVFTEGRKLEELAQEATAEGVDVVASSTWLVGAEKALAGEVGAETVFRKALSKLPERWDFVFVDCPPALGLLSISALVGCRELLVPVEARVMALSGLVGLLQTVETVRDRLNPDLALVGLLACRVDARTKLSSEVVDSLRQRFGKELFKTVIRENVKLAEAYSHTKPITTYDPRSAGAEDYRAAAKELARRRAKV